MPVQMRRVGMPGAAPALAKVSVIPSSAALYGALGKGPN